MYNVSALAREYKQPRGGFLPPKEMECIELFNDGIELHENENLSTNIVGMVVDYMFRFMTTNDVKNAFSISLSGARLIKEEDKAKALAKKIKGLDDESIKCACQLVGYDTIMRAGGAGFRPVEEIVPDEDTIENIVTMVNRLLAFEDKYGPVICDKLTFLGAYTEKVICGDADFMTEDTLWDIKVSKNPIKSQHTLQLLMYYLMGKRAPLLCAEYDFDVKVKKIGIVNPKLNVVYLKKIEDIDEAIIKEIETKVIEYND